MNPSKPSYVVTFITYLGFLVTSTSHLYHDLPQSYSHSPLIHCKFKTIETVEMSSSNADMNPFTNNSYNANFFVCAKWREIFLSRSESLSCFLR